MKKLLCDKKFNIAYSALAVLIMWAVWLIAFAAVKNEYLVPSFTETARQFFTLFSQGFFWKAFGATLFRTVIAFLISFAAGLACACLATAVKPFAAFMRPVAALLRSMPTMAVLLLILVWLTPRTAPVLVAVLVLFPMIYSQLLDGISGVDGALSEMASVYKIGVKKTLLSIYVPQIAPTALLQTGTNLSFGIKLVISAEVMAATYTAVGGLMLQAQAYINLPRLAALTLCAIIFGIAAETVFGALSSRVFKWKRGVKNA